MVSYSRRCISDGRTGAPVIGASLMEKSGAPEDEFGADTLGCLSDDDGDDRPCPRCLLDPAAVSASSRVVDGEVEERW